MAPKQKEVCLACGKAFGKDYSVQCAICGLWIHLKPCSGISDEHFKYLEEQAKATGSAYWACRSCMNYSQAITQKVKVIEKDIESLKGDVKENKTGVQRVENTIEEMKRQMEKNRLELEKKIDNCKAEMREEWREREIRRKNLVFHRIEEPEDGVRAGEERRKQDLDRLKIILETIGLVGMETEIKACRRIGERSEEARPIIVVMKTEEAKKRILEEARKLRGTEFEEVGIVPDLTNEQRREEAELLEEAERRNQTMRTEDEISKNVKWLVVGPRGEKRLIRGIERERGGPYRGRGGARGTVRRGSYQYQPPNQNRQQRDRYSYQYQPQNLTRQQRDQLSRKRTMTDREVEVEEVMETATQSPPAKR